MVMPGTAGFQIAGLAVTTSVAAPSVIPVRAAYAALDDAHCPVSKVTAVIHVGSGDGYVSEAVRDGVGALRCLHTFDVDSGPVGVVSALAVGASLIDDDGTVVVTVAEPDGGTAALVLAGGASPEAATREFDQNYTDDVGPYILKSASPVRGLLDCRRSGLYDVVVVAAGESAPDVSVRCRLERPRRPAR